MAVGKVTATVVWGFGMSYIYMIHSFPGIAVASIVSAILLFLYLVDGPHDKVQLRKNGSTGTIDDIGQVKVWKSD